MNKKKLALIIVIAVAVVAVVVIAVLYGMGVIGGEALPGIAGGR